MTDDCSPLDIEFWVRDSGTATVSDRQQEVYTTLQEYRDRGQIASVTINRWGNCIRCPQENDNSTPSAYDSDSWATYCLFKEWATRTGYDLRPAFHHCTRTSFIDGHRSEVISPPLLCLAVNVDSELEAVFPCFDGEHLWTVADGLALLDSTRSPSWPDFGHTGLHNPDDTVSNIA